MKGTDELKELAERIYHRMIDKTVNDWGMNMEGWDWVPGVGVISILAYDRLVGNHEAIEYLQQWTERNKHLSEQVNVINSMAPYAIFPDLYRLSGDRWYLDTATKIGDWMQTKHLALGKASLNIRLRRMSFFPNKYGRIPCLWLYLSSPDLKARINSISIVLDSISFLLYTCKAKLMIIPTCLQSYRL